MQTANGNKTAVVRKALTEEQVNDFWIDGYLGIGKILEMTKSSCCAGSMIANLN